VLRGIRGATSVENNDELEILQNTKELLLQMVEANALHIEDIAAVLFSVTRDLDAVFPAQAARELGWKYVPLLDVQEMDAKNGLKGTIRVLLLANSVKRQEEIKHIYLERARELRPDLT